MNKRTFLLKAGLRLCLVLGISTQTNMIWAQRLPIKPTRTISFTTDEGSYMNVDVSPDGKTLAFDLLGDIYTMSVVGGKATQVTHGMSLNIHPVWSPDRKRLAFTSDRTGDFHLCVINLAEKNYITLGKIDQIGGGPTAYQSSAVNWTPDAHYVALGDSAYGIAGGQLPVKLLCQELVRFTKNGNYYGVAEKKLYLYNPNGQGTFICACPEGEPKNITVSPDGKFLACIAATGKDSQGLMIEDLKTKSSRALVPSLTLADKRYQSELLQHFCFSPDSKTVYISYGGKIHQITIKNGEDRIIPFSADVKVNMGPLKYNSYHVGTEDFKVKYVRSANVSPDGQHLVFAALDKIWLMDLPKGKPRILTEQPIAQFQPTFSPDSKWVAYVTWCDTSGGQLWKVPLNGKYPAKITKVIGQYQRPAWSPDGTSLAVLKRNNVFGDRDEQGMGELQLVSADGKNTRKIADSVSFTCNPVFSEDGGNLIYRPFYINNGWRKHPLILQLVSKNLRTGTINALVTGTSQPDLAGQQQQQRSLSPDKRYLTYSWHEDVYLEPVYQMTDSIRVSAMNKQTPAIRFAAGVDPYWEKGGKILAWSYGNHFYRIDPDKVMTAAERKLAGSSVEEKIFTSVSVKPDETFVIAAHVPYGHAHGTIMLKNARIITMQGDKIIANGTILIKDGRFTAIGKAQQITIPKGSRVIDLKGKTIIPGIVDVHLHMRIPPDVWPQQSWMFLANLAYGVTTARDPSQSLDGFGYAELIRSGQMLGPRLFTVGRAVRFGDGITRMDGQEDADRVVAKRKLFGGSEIKQYVLPTRLQKEWLAIACKQQGLNMTNEGAYDPVEQIGMLKDGSTGIEHNPQFGDVYNDIIQLYAKSGSYLTPTLQVAYGIEEGKEYFKEKYWNKPDAKLERFMQSDSGQTEAHPTANGAETLQTILLSTSKDTIHPEFLAPAHIDTRILHAGGKITLGSHGNDEGIGPHNEIWALVMGGFTPMQALRAATLSGAEALGIQKDLGSIEVGKIADLIILNGNPLDDIHNTRDIKYVMKDGILYDGDTLDEIWPVKKKCPVWKSPKVLGNGYTNSEDDKKKSGGAYNPNDDND